MYCSYLRKVSPYGALILQQRRVRADINGPGRERTSAVHDLGVWGTTFSLIAGTDLTCLACRYISPFPPVYVHPTACDSSCQEKDAIGIRARGRTFKVIVAPDPLSKDPSVTLRHERPLHCDVIAEEGKTVLESLSANSGVERCAVSG